MNNESDLTQIRKAMGPGYQVPLTTEQVLRASTTQAPAILDTPRPMIASRLRHPIRRSSAGQSNRRRATPSIIGIAKILRQATRQHSRLI